MFDRNSKHSFAYLPTHVRAIYYMSYTLEMSIASGKLLYSTGSSAQCSDGLEVWGGEWEGVNTHTQKMCERVCMLIVKNPPAKAGDTRDTGSIPGSGRSPGEENGNPLPYCCLGNPTDRGAWQATAHGVAKSGTRLSSRTWDLMCAVHVCVHASVLSSLIKELLLLSPTLQVRKSSPKVAE